MVNPVKPPLVKPVISRTLTQFVIFPWFEVTVWSNYRGSMPTRRLHRR